MPQRRFRLPIILLAVLALFAALALVAYRAALHRLESAVLASLGPRATIEAFDVRWQGVELRKVRVPAARGGKDGWPAEDEFRAERIVLQPQWGEMWHAVWGGGDARWQITSVRVEGGYLSVWRTPRGLRLLPSVMPRHDAAVVHGGPASAAGAPPASALTVLIGRLVLADGMLDFYDGTVPEPPHRVRLQSLQAEIGPIAWPQLDRPVPLTVSAAVPGLPDAAGRQGQLRIDGEVTPATRDARVKASLRGADLRVFQPYLLRVNEGGVERGQLDLTLDATVQRSQLRAPGTIVFTDMAPKRKNLLDSFAGVPQQLVLAAMEKQGRIELHFVLEGRLDDAKFRIDEDLATRVGVGLAALLGVSVGGVVEGLGGVIKGLFGK